MPSPSGIPDHLIDQLARNLQRGAPGNLDRRPVNILTNELRHLNANLTRLIELEEKIKEREEKATKG